MRSQLLSLGVQVPEMRYAFEPNQTQRSSGHVPAAGDYAQQPVRHAPENAYTDHRHEYGSHSASRKRKRDDPLPMSDDEGQEPRQHYDLASRDLMPPPLHIAHPQALAHYGATTFNGYDANGRHAPHQPVVQTYGSDGWRAPVDGMYQSGYAPSRQSHSSFVQRPVANNQNRSPFYIPSRAEPMRDPSQDVRQSLRTLPTLLQNRQTLASSRTPRALATPSPHKGQAVFETSVASPFFTRQIPGGDGSVMRPPSRRSHISQPYHASQQHTSRPNGQQPYPSQHTLQSDFRTNSARHPQSTLRPRSRSPLRQTFAAPQYQQQPFIPQTPRNAQGLFSRPDRPPPSTTQASNAIRPNVHTNRVLHQSRQRSTRPGTINPDSALNQFPGVRGVHSQRGMPAYERPGFAPQGSLSTAGGRRSIRR
ncbi:hypothetical protein BDY17DRAFT_29832 [Neohortaea acidophila]|uniref:Uncharacterized protein n=1 Tax=Neohortaea acidophila TaxID=245834 RepID=A0A6A6PL41_9PEZI|nr:uncharacterized protein BDY17DRAFT_29832 [Neohortaea acidophila]KAF2479987.1 hypothetical protein BDY17DRAFT_29832 [Neohortaea acidophila]